MSGERIADVALERYLLRELAPEEMDRIEQALKSDATMAGRLRALERSQDELLGRFPPNLMAEKIRRRAMEAGQQEEPRSMSRLLFSPIALGVIAVLVLAGIGIEVFWKNMPNPAKPLEDETRIKGGSLRLSIFRKTTQGVEQLRSGSSVRQNDLIQLSYQVAGQKYGTIVSVDGRNAISVHLPERGSLAAELVSGRAVPLAYAYRLDDAPTAEVFFFVTANERFPVQLVRDAIAQSHGARQLSLPAGYHQYAVILDKESK